MPALAHLWAVERNEEARLDFSDVVNGQKVGKELIELFMGKGEAIRLAYEARRGIVGVPVERSRGRGRCDGHAGRGVPETSMYASVLLLQCFRLQKVMMLVKML